MKSSASIHSNSRTMFLCHAAAWYGLIIASPLLIAINNQQEIAISISALWPGLLALYILSSVTSWCLGKVLSPKSGNSLAMIMLAMAFVLAVQSNVLHPLTYFGQFDGSSVNFRKYGHWFWLEWFGFLAGIVSLSWLFTRVRQMPAWVPWVPIVSFTLLWVPALFAVGNQSNGIEDNDHDTRVFEFSSNRNLIHLLPDALQGDVVEQVFREDPGLAMKFRGFTLFADHLGTYHGTAPALPALLTGQPFDFERGHSFWITPFIEENSYQNKIADSGYALDLVTIDRAYCVSRARSCVSRPFSDWKSRGYVNHRSENALYSVKLLADLSLYRLLPSFLKEKIHNKGEWMFADSSMDGASPWPDPVIREWIEKMQVTDTAGNYKFYHYIGTHKPPFWNSDCQRQSGLTRSRDHFLGQAHCILKGIALLLDKLEAQGIYDKTAIVISGDHGSDVPPGDLAESPASVLLSTKMMGAARPALLIKSMDSQQPLQISYMPTSLLDVPGLAVSVSEAGDGGIEQLAADDPSAMTRERNFYHYSVKKLSRMNTEPVPYDTYRIRGPVREGSSWELLNIITDQQAPQQFPVISYRTASDYLRGAKLNANKPDKELTWIVRNQFGFLFSPPEPGPLQLILTVHVPKWIANQTFKVQINQGELDKEFELQTVKKFWQEVRIDAPASLIQQGNNFVSLKFDRLVASPSAPSMKAAALLKSIQVVPAGEETPP